MSFPTLLLFPELSDKRCTRCGATKPLAEFNRRTMSRDGRQPKCRACSREVKKAYWQAHKHEMYPKNLAWRKANPEKWRGYGRKHYLRSKYGMDQAQYDEMFASQGGVCALCGRPGRHSKSSIGPLVVDHDHETGAVRGLLCDACNVAIGMLRDDADLIRRAASYVERDPSVP